MRLIIMIGARLSDGGLRIIFKMEELILMEVSSFPEESDEQMKAISELITDVIEDRDLLPEYKSNLEKFKANNK